MKNPELSETQFVVGFLREFLNSRTRWYWFHNLLRLPSTRRERKTGADLIIERGFRGSDFFQFKRSDYLLNRRGLPSSQRKIDAGFFDCYRFKVYNSVKTRQFDTLRGLARNPSNYCAYIAPLFYTFNDFDNYFARTEIMQNSIEIECSQFSAGPFAGLKFKKNWNHHILYNNRDSHCWFCSDPLKASARNAKSLKQREITEEIDFSYHLTQILETLREFEYPVSNILYQSNRVKANVIAEILYRQADIIWIPRIIN